MHWLLEALWFVLMLGIVEALVKPIAKQAVQRQVLKAAPELLQRLDPLMPQWLAECNGAELELRVRALAEEVTGEDWSQVSLRPLWQLFDPRLCAEHTSKAWDLAAAAETESTLHTL